jgi:acyl carrier protein
MNASDKILRLLIELCRENEIVPPGQTIHDNDDLFEYGVIDSMGLTILASAIEDKFEIEILPELFIAELRTPRMIANYIADNTLMSATAE